MKSSVFIAVLINLSSGFLFLVQGQVCNAPVTHPNVCKCWDDVNLFYLYAGGFGADACFEAYYCCNSCPCFGRTGNCNYDVDSYCLYYSYPDDCCLAIHRECCPY